ncbi:MAG: hypothetical protein M1823_006001 [Watsoniomyces obsoletus]|nr:MAG: hypothetical protein M1823_006001 [Watsoniomyces obsoletus]
MADKSSSTSSATNGTTSVPTAKSSSTLSSSYGASTPNSSLPPQSSTPNLPEQVMSQGSQPRPGALPQGSRLSYAGQSNSPVNGSGSRSALPISPFAPRLLSVQDNAWVHQKVLLVYGQIGDPAQLAIDGTVTIYHHQNSFPPTNWPVCDSHFKALVHLTPGLNRLRFSFTSPKVASNGSSNPAHTSGIALHYLHLSSAPPLQLAILVAKDSPMTYDAVPERIQREGNGIETAVRKFRMAAYLWQAFTAEQMYRNGFGHRCFRLEEEWQTGTLSTRDHEPGGAMRNEAKVHIIHTDKTVAELRDLNCAQQYQHASRKGELFSVAMDAVRAHFQPRPNQTRYVSVLILDTHWDPRLGTIRAHAALGGGAGDIQLAIFGSHALQSYPASIEEVVPAFSDCTRTDTNHVANDCNDAGSSWEAANLGIGAHLHETGHLLGCPHQESGIMRRDYVTLNRTFTCREPYSTRTKAPGLRLCLPKDECSWHRLDCLRFRYHPCFRVPQDLPPNADGSVHVWPVGTGTAIVTAAAGIAFVELYADEEETCRSHLEFVVDPNGAGGLPRQVTLIESELRGRLPEDRRSRRLRLEIHSAGSGKQVVEDWSELTSKTATVKLTNGQLGFRGGKLGFSRMDGSRPCDVVLESAVVQTKLLVQIKVYHGFAVDGMEFIYEDFTSQLFGTRGGKPGGSEFSLGPSAHIKSTDTRRGETIMGFYLRAGLWIDGIEIITSLGRRSGVFGNPTGGSGHTLIPPRGYKIVGISGSVAAWVDGFSLIIAR